jgi:hypothetical protein
MTHVLIRMSTTLLGLTTRLLTSLTIGIFAFARSMAGFTTEVRSATELVTADIATADILQPALLVLEGLLPAHAPLLHKERTFGTSFIVLMAVVRYLRVAACFGTLAGVSTGRRLCTARKRWMQDCATATAADFVKDGFTTSATWALVTKLFTYVCTALE